MQNRQDEIEEFKSGINLTEYAASRGYVLDVKRSGKSSAIMRDASNDIIVVTRNPNGHWVFWAVHDDSDNGTIIDFVQKRNGFNLGLVRKELRPWIAGTQRIKMPTELFVPDLQPISQDIGGVRARYAAFEPITKTHPYLETSRSIPADIILDARFKSRIRIDGHNNAIFPHYNLDGICGFEIKNRNFTGFARAGIKGLWCSRPYPTPQCLVIAESAIDALSYAAMHPGEDTNYVSVSGQLSPDQEELLKLTMTKMPPETSIILALDNDEGGTALAERITGLFSPEDCAGATLRPHLPPEGGQDWNDALRASTGEIDQSDQMQPPDI